MRVVLRAVVFLVAIVFLPFCFDDALPIRGALASITLHFLQTLPSHMASQLLLEVEVKMLRIASNIAKLPGLLKQS